MPIYMEISPLHRLVTIVARGAVSGDEVRNTAQKLADARVRRFAKIVEVASASFTVEPADIVAQAARTARILWAMLTHNQPYRAPAIG